MNIIGVFLATNIHFFRRMQIGGSRKWGECNVFHFVNVYQNENIVPEMWSNWWQNVGAVYSQKGLDYMAFENFNLE